MGKTAGRSYGAMVAAQYAQKTNQDILGSFVNDDKYNKIIIEMENTESAILRDDHEIKPMDMMEKLKVLDHDYHQPTNLAVIPPMEHLKKVKLTVIEKEAMEEFIARGLPDIQDYDEPRILGLYLTGNDTGDLLKIFPNTTVGGIAYLKAKENWPQKRQELLDEVQYRSKFMLGMTKLKSVQTVTNLVNIFNDQLSDAIAKYNQTGDISSLPPDLIPKDLKGFEALMRLLKMFGDIKVSGNAEDIAPTNPGQQSNIQVNIGSGNEKAENKALDFLKTVVSNTKK